jgi:glucose-6-phosphate isomerase
MTRATPWERFKQYYYHDETLGFALDVSRMNFDAAFFARMRPAMARAFQAMAQLEGGALANPDEQRMVGHYWLRAPERCPLEMLAREVREATEKIKSFAAQIHAGGMRGGKGAPFTDFLLVGIGGSALGPQLVADALATAGDKLRPHFLDNTDPDGIARVLGSLAAALDRTLAIVISKSGGTAETRNGMLATADAYARAGLTFAHHAVTVTGVGSALDKQAREEGWLATFPMWDWVGGRTSVTSAVGLLPAALQEIDIDELLAGARAMDESTRRPEVAANPAALLALMWHWAGNGRGDKAMVVLPYKDRLILFSRYLQQLIMESLGKERDLAGNLVHQGIAVYGNKGSTDQHAYVQQLRDGRNDFFVTFIEVLRDEAGSGMDRPLEVAPGVTVGDYLEGFLLGTRRALAEGGRESVTITLRELTPRTLGALIALFERAVGLYASLVGINAYHQPGVEAGKKAAAAVLDLQSRLLMAMSRDPAARTAAGWAEALGEPGEVETLFKLLERLAAAPARSVARQPGPTACEAKYFWQFNPTPSKMSQA